MIQVHIVDWAHHLLQGALDPRHPLYDANQAHIADDLLRRHYKMADELIGAVTAELDPLDDIVVLGDHGQDLHHTTVRVNEILAQQGYLTWVEAGGEDDITGVDWSRTRAYAAGNYVYVNLSGREPTGIVDAGDFSPLVDELVVRLLALFDPNNGERPVLIAGPKTHFASLGADGEGVGDVVFCLASGYQARNDRGPMFSQTIPLREFTSGHDHFWPLDPRLETRLYAAGPSFRQEHLTMRHSVIDVAPTICAALGMAPPPDCQGRAMRGILAETTPEVSDTFGIVGQGT